MKTRSYTSALNLREDSVAREILSYLSEHQNAQDTLEGIMEWWLLEQHIKRIRKQIRAALDELVKERLVLETHRKDGRASYRINRRRAATVKRLLAPESQQESQPENIALPESIALKE